jgi:hypothetical protein
MKKIFYIPILGYILAHIHYRVNKTEDIEELEYQILFNWGVWQIISSTITIIIILLT